MDVLQKVQTDVTVTTNRIYDDLINIYIDDYGFIAKHISNIKDLSFKSIISRMNVSIPWVINQQS